MAKKSFILYYEYRKHFGLLSDDQLGKLIRALYDYEELGIEPNLNGVLQMAFSFICEDLDANKEKYETTCKANKENGKKGGRPSNKKPIGFSENPIKPKKAERDLERELEREHDIEGIKKHSSKVPIDKFSNDSIEMEISKHLFSRMRENNPGCKEPNWQTWCKSVDCILRIDKRDKKQVISVIDFCQKDSFWKQNILSTKKFREKYDQLVVKMNTSTQTIRRKSSEELLEEAMKGGYFGLPPGIETH